MKNTCAFLLLSIVFLSCSSEKKVTINFDESIEQVVFAVSDIKKAIASKAYINSNNDDIKIEFQLDDTHKEAQGYTIKKISDYGIIVKSGDATGLMYGGLELAELIKTGTKLSEITTITDKPYIKNRGIKFNIPLDIRTSSFDDSGDAAQSNIATMWELDFWEGFLDNMARHRYNTISYWNAHPFSSMVKLDEYTDVALQDVLGTTIEPKENQYAWNVPELPSIKPLENLKVIKKMTIDEKIVFWQKVMKHAKNRGINIYFITWNICLNGAAPPGSNKEVGDKKGKYGITNDYKNEISKDYLRKSVKQFLINYPDVTGIGVTAGENMRTPMVDDDKEKWLWETYGLGILDAKKMQPKRKVNFIHRFWWTDMKIVKKYWGDYPDNFDMSFKYSKAHMYSKTDPTFAKPFIKWMESENLKSWWNLRNDDIFIHRWGNPEYASSFIKNLPLAQTSGYHMGSDGYVWGREFISKNPTKPRQLEIDKHWFKFLLWGRLGYNPDLKNERFEKIIGAKFPETDAKLLLETWSESSKIIPQVNQFSWGDWDYHWQPEACMELWNDLKPIDKFISNPTMQDSGTLNAEDYAKAILNKEVITKKTPLEVIKNLRDYSKNSRINADKLLSEGNTNELKQTLLDIKSMSFLGDYYADKFSAAVELAFYKETGKGTHQQKAISYLKDALKDWEKYRDINVNRYLPQNFARLRTFDWNKQLEWVKKDIEIAKSIKTDKGVQSK
ncbi:hypothetical protein [Polaribacter sp. SA4-12]|uniref:hypothetical protein n=1 Tax=Polaribacter sp. SA4-12 TaxID=1312072 RepID=UPI000B3D29A7|nr:hypothetical protein [Polaribacter sp. SA4-12]ARV16526.1 hypothetical protein BTO07_15890 [Polaribacter sp. SA4-12]